MEFMPFKLNVFNAVVWAAIIALCMGISKGIGTPAGARLFVIAILVGCPAYYGSVLAKSFWPEH